MTAPSDNIPEQETGGVLTIDLAAIVGNWRDLAARTGSAECAAVVKADGYGCGLVRVAHALAVAGCRTFFAAHLEEARQARNAAPDATIYVLNGLMPGTGQAHARDDLRPVLCSPEELSEWSAFRAATGWNGGAALHIDTGINRLGFDAAHAATMSSPTGITLLMSHFGFSDNPAHPLNAVQMGRFRAIRERFPETPASLANSSGIFLGPDAHHDMVRPGAALYGVNPTPGHSNPMQPVVQLQGRVLQVRDVAAGDTVGYAAVWTARRASRVAIVAIGYADGFPRAAGSSDLHAGADAMVAGRRCPLAGRVSMDVLAVDVTDAPEGQPVRGDLVSFLDNDMTVDEVAGHSGTIGYEVLTRLGRRYRRVYRAA